MIAQPVEIPPDGLALRPIPRPSHAFRLWQLGLLLAVALGGCQAPAARVSADHNPDANSAPCLAILGRQLLEDSAVETAEHPLRSAWTLLSQPAAYLRNGTEGVVRKRLALTLTPRPDPIAPCRPSLDPAALEKELLKLSGDPLRPADVRIQVDGGEALAALHDVIDVATSRIDVLMFLWDNDPLGQEIAERLAAKASPTCRVRVLVDGGGNLMQGEPREAPAAELNRVVCWLAKQPHVEVIRTRDPFLRFDHRKLVLADGRFAWSGGRNFTHAAFHDHHDLSYTLQGPLVEQLTERFEKFWLEQGGKAAAAIDPAPPVSDETLARLVATRPRERQLAAVLYHTIDLARDHVYIENPYITDSLLLSKLAQARRRGADVRVILTLQGDSDIINHANRVTVDRLLAAGVRVYLYPGMTHVKATAIDGCWAYLGTANFDPLSLRHNRELGLAISAGPVIERLETELFLPDFNPEWERKERLDLSPTDYAAEGLASLFL